MCVILFLSNTTRGNSSNDPTGFPNGGIDYFPLDYPYKQISATPKFILLKDNNARYENSLSFAYIAVYKLINERSLLCIIVNSQNKFY